MKKAWLLLATTVAATAARSRVQARDVAVAVFRGVIRRRNPELYGPQAFAR